MANNIEQWHHKNIIDNYFENDDDFEKLKKSPTKFEKQPDIEEDNIDIYRKGTFKLFTS